MLLKHASTEFFLPNSVAGQDQGQFLSNQHSFWEGGGAQNKHYFKPLIISWFRGWRTLPENIVVLQGKIRHVGQDLAKVAFATILEGQRRTFAGKSCHHPPNTEHEVAPLCISTLRNMINTKNDLLNYIPFKVCFLQFFDLTLVVLACSQTRSMTISVLVLHVVEGSKVAHKY